MAVKGLLYIKINRMEIDRKSFLLGKIGAFQDLKKLNESIEKTWKNDKRSLVIKDFLFRVRNKTLDDYIIKTYHEINKL